VSELALTDGQSETLIEMPFQAWGGASGMGSFDFVSVSRSRNIYFAQDDKADFARNDNGDRKNGEPKLPKCSEQRRCSHK
jgi:hypothetical protein